MRIDEVIAELEWMKKRFIRNKRTMQAIEISIDYLEDMPFAKDMEAKYTASNGYTGHMYSNSSLAVYNEQGIMIFHTGFRTPNTFNELKECTDTFDDFLKIISDQEENKDDR